MGILSVTMLAADLTAAAQKTDMAWMHVKENDPWGLTVAAISIIVVLCALIVLSTVIRLFATAISQRAKQENAKKGWMSKLVSKQNAKNGKASKVTAAAAQEEDETGEIIAAIAVAIKLHREALHDRESEVITINSVARSYSPWSSKIYGLTRNPR